MTQSPSWERGGITCMAGVPQWMATCSSEGIGKEGQVVGVPYTGETFDSMELQDSGDMVESL